MVSLMEICTGCSVIGLVLFLVLYFHNPTSLLNGFIFDCELGMLILTLLCILQVYRLNALGTIVLLMLFLITAVIFLVGIWMVIGYLLLNAVRVFRRERHTLANMLSLIIGLGLLVQMIVFILAKPMVSNPVYMIATSFLVIIECWLAITLICFITTSWISKIDRPGKDTDYVIILGCGLLHGNEVSPLLGGRIDRAIRFYEKAMKKGKSPKLVFSGGQGNGETVSEAEAMKAYAIAHKIPEESILVETKSRTTLENFQFSKEVMDADAAGKPYKCAFSTSSYHVLRGRMYARKVGLKKAKGLGAHTARYYVPNAMIREYVAIMLNNKKTSAIQLGLITLCYIIGVGITLSR